MADGGIMKGIKIVATALFVALALLLFSVGRLVLGTATTTTNIMLVVAAVAVIALIAIINIVPFKDEI